MKMKNFMCILALLAALALIMTGCPGEGDDGNDDTGGNDSTGGNSDVTNLSEIFSASNDEPQTKAHVTINTGNNSVVFTFTGDELWGELITPENARWDVSSYTGITFDYKSTGQATIFIQDTDSIFIFGIDGSDGWGAVNQADNWETLTLPFSILQRQPWFGEQHNFGTLPVVKMCFQITSGDDAKKFEIRNLTANKK